MVTWQQDSGAETEHVLVERGQEGLGRPCLGHKMLWPVGYRVECTRALNEYVKGPGGWGEGNKAPK